MQNVAAALPATPPVPTQPPATQPVAATAIATTNIKDKIAHWLFFYGFASIFLINFVNAVVDPKSFQTLLNPNVFVPTFLPTRFMVNIAAVNDLAVGCFILSKWKKKWIYAWAGAWLLIVAGVKAGHFLA
jgi:hypothetical protein